MNTATLQEPMGSPHQDRLPQNQYAYRAVSKSAIAAVLFAVLSVVASFLDAAFLLLPVLGVGFGVLGVVNCIRFPEELIGRTAAIFGLVISGICLVGAGSYHSYVRATEVPPDHTRMSFYDLKPDDPLPYSKEAIEMDGKKVFLKGYVRPGAKKRKLKEFILVGDFKSCCFGGNPDLADVVAVRIVGEDTVDYGYSKRGISGTFRLNRQARETNEKDVPKVYYEIEAQQVR